MIYTIFNNELINFYRKTIRIEERLKFLSFNTNSIEHAGAENGVSAEQEIGEAILKDAVIEFWDSPDSENYLLQCLNDILDELEDWERILINQKSKGMTYREIATYIDKPENQLKVYYSRLKNKIKTKLKERIKNNHNE